VSNVSDELLRRLAEYPEDRFSINPRIFEETVAELLSRMGYDVVLTPRSGDKGRDVIAALATPTAPVLMLVECKRYARDRKVGPEPISRVWSRLFDDKANMAMVVTTSSFTPVAKEFANARGYQLSLQDGDKYIRWIKSVMSRGA
jgi:HJR/Mrr/RecB family endonuclease